MAHIGAERRRAIKALLIGRLGASPMGLQDRAKFSNASQQEHAAMYPCDRYLDGPYEGWVRAIDVDASAAVLFRWLCQLRIAPYSYDLLDNLGRRSPRQLTSGLEHLAQGQRFLVFQIRDFERDRHISGVALPSFRRIYGPLAITYAVQPKGDFACRLAVKLNAGASGPLQRVRRAALAWGDLLMMHKQLDTLKELAERQMVTASLTTPRS